MNPYSASTLTQLPYNVKLFMQGVEGSDEEKTCFGVLEMSSQEYHNSRLFWCVEKAGLSDTHRLF